MKIELEKIIKKYFEDGYYVMKIWRGRDLELSFLDKRNMHVGNLRLKQRNYPS